jgi:serine protease AprX
VSSADDTTAPWSAWGYTEDGFAKPDVSAPGRYMVGPVPAGSTLTQEKPQNMVGTTDEQLSGTSFAAPVVAGTVADMLARHPSWTPDQVKGVLMRTARFLPNATPHSAGLGEITPPRAVWSAYTPNPNAGLEQFESVVNGVPSFNASAWVAAATANAAWNAVSWSDLVSWSDVSWSDQALAQVSWSDVSWSDEVSWSDVSWSDQSAADASVEDAAEGDDTSTTADITASSQDVSAAADNPDVGVPVDGLDPTAALGLDTSSSTSTTSATTSTTTSTP